MCVVIYLKALANRRNITVRNKTGPNIPIESYINSAIRHIIPNTIRKNIISLIGNKFICGIDVMLYILQTK